MGGVWDPGSGVTLGDDALLKEGDGVLARAGCTSLLHSVDPALCEIRLEFVSDSTGVALFFVTGICQMGRGSLDDLWLWGVEGRLLLCPVSFSEAVPVFSVLWYLGIELRKLVLLDRGSTSDVSPTSLSVDTDGWLEANDGPPGTYCTGHILGCGYGTTPPWVMYQNGGIGMGATLGTGTAMGTKLGTAGAWLSLISEWKLGDTERQPWVIGLNIMWASVWAYCG